MKLKISKIYVYIVVLKVKIKKNIVKRKKKKGGKRALKKKRPPNWKKKKEGALKKKNGRRVWRTIFCALLFISLEQ